MLGKCRDSSQGDEDEAPAPDKIPPMRAIFAGILMQAPVALHQFWLGWRHFSPPSVSLCAESMVFLGHIFVCFVPSLLQSLSLSSLNHTFPLNV